MNDHESIKLQKFTADQLMSQTVFKSVRDSFLKPTQNKDISYLAATRIAVDLLTDAWKDLEQFKAKNESGADKSGNIGM